MTSRFGPAQEQACAILEHASRPVRFDAIKIESCMDSLPVDGAIAFATLRDSRAAQSASCRRVHTF